MRWAALVVLMSSPSYAQQWTCAPARASDKAPSNGCYIYVRPGMIIGNNAVQSGGGFFLRLDADGAWRQVPMFFIEGIEERNWGALAMQDRIFGTDR